MGALSAEQKYGGQERLVAGSSYGPNSIRGAAAMLRQ